MVTFATISLYTCDVRCEATPVDLREVRYGVSFPNASRCFLPSRHAVQFWGYDGAFEIPFFVTEDALSRICPSMRHDEEGILKAFDAHCAIIREAASRVYSRGRAESYELTAKSV
jgi:hypothetical protein